MSFYTSRLDRVAAESSSVFVLWCLSFLTYEDVRYSLAGNPSAPRNVVHRMLRNQMSGIRSQAATHPKLNATELGLLALDPDQFVRASVASNANTPYTWVEVLIKDSFPLVRRAAVTNPILDANKLREIKHSFQDDIGVKTGLLQNPNTPLDILASLAKDEDYTIVSNAIGVVANWSEEDWLKKLADIDGEQWVSYPRSWVLKVLG